jgi:hypothetical protein
MRATVSRETRSKYGNVKVTMAGQEFDSKREGLRYLVLKQRERNGEISNLERQVTYILAPSVKILGEKRARPALRLKADFRYLENGQTVVDDAKGYSDTAFRIRQHLMKSVHGIDVRLS